MNPSRSLLVAALASFLAGIGLAGDVHAVGSPACDAGDIVGEDPGCLQESTLCSITQAYEIAGSNCNLCVGGRKEDDRCSDGSDCPGGSCAPSGVDCCEIDFGNRDVTVTDAGVLDLGRGRLIIRAASFTVEDGGEVVGEGKKNGSPLTNGGTVEIVTTGGVEVQGPTGSIDVSAKDQAGEIDIAAVGPVTIAGRLQARNRFHFEAASGGSIHITSGDNVVAAEGSEISARGGPRGMEGMSALPRAGTSSLQMT